MSEIVGVDPKYLKEMIDSLDRNATALQLASARLQTSFVNAELTDPRVHEIRNIGQWAQDQLPHLKRRQSLAEVLQRSQPNGTSAMVQLTEPFLSADDARQKAQELAGKIDKNGEIPHEVWEELKKYQLDPDFAEEFFRKLSPEQVVSIGGRLLKEPGYSNEKTAKNRFSAFAIMMAVASHRITFDVEKFNELGSSFMDRRLLGQLLQHGAWDKETVKRIGTKAIHVLDAANLEDVALILEGIAHHPIAANEFYKDDKNFDRINAMSRGQVLGWETDDSKLGKGLGALIKAATVDARAVYEQMRPPGDKSWTNPAEELTRRLLYDAEKHSDKPVRFEGVRETYRDIVMEYYNDLRESVTSPVPDYFGESDPHRAGVEASASAWTALTRQALASTKVAAGLELFFTAKNVEHSKRVKDVTDKPGITGLSNWQNGRMINWFNGQLDQMKRDKAEYEKQLESDRTDLWAAVMAGAATGAVGFTGGPVTGFLGAGAGAFVGFLQEFGKANVKSALNASREMEAKAFDEKSWRAASASYQHKAQEAFEEGQIKEVTLQDGTKRPGDPNHYEKEYGGTFTEKDSSGKIRLKDPDPATKPPEGMTPEGRRAYMHWLQDPAVQNAASPPFIAEQAGAG